MSRQQLVALLIAALVVISAALYLSTERNAVREVHGQPLFPSLAGELDTVTSLSVLKGSATPSVTVHKQGDEWTVAERANYPADVSKLRRLLLSLSDAKILEQKTSDPANYSIIGVEDPTKPGATGAQIELIAKAGKQDLIVGKPAEQGSFVRRVGEKSSYVVEPAISFEAEPRFWIDTRLLDISADKIQSIQFKPDTGPAYSVSRVSEPAPKPAEGKSAPNAAAAASAAATPSTAAAPSAAAAPPAAAASSKFVLEGVPSGRQALDSNSLAPSPSTFSSLNDDDVAPVGDIDFSKPSTATLTFADGSVITLTGAAVGEKRWIQVAAPKDAALSAKTAGRAFEIANYRYDQIFKPLEQLLVPKPVPSAKPAAASAKPAAPGAKPVAPGAKSPPPSAKKPAAAPEP
jgi:uncharacterized protein DUF4340